MCLQADTPLVYIGPDTRWHRPLGFGGWSFGSDEWTGWEDSKLLSAMRSALEHGISVVTYNSIKHGILGGRYARDLELVAGDQRKNILLFRENVWPIVYDATQSFVRVAEQAGRPLVHLAVRWLLLQHSVTSVLDGARNARQAIANAQALDDAITDSLFDQLAAISDRVVQQIPEAGKPYG